MEEQCCEHNREGLGSREGGMESCNSSQDESTTEGREDNVHVPTVVYKIVLSSVRGYPTLRT